MWFSTTNLQHAIGPQHMDSSPLTSRNALTDLARSEVGQACHHGRNGRRAVESGRAYRLLVRRFRSWRGVGGGRGRWLLPWRCRCHQHRPAARQRCRVAVELPRHRRPPASGVCGRVTPAVDAVLSPHDQGRDAQPAMKHQGGISLDRKPRNLDAERPEVPSHAAGVGAPSFG